MKVISFCIYGSKDKYCKGLDENLKLMQLNLTDFNAFIYIGDQVPTHWIEKYQTYDFVKIFYTNRIGHDNMINRFFAIDENDVEIAFIRDIDSRVHDRDIWCIRHFEKSQYMFHTIRDHPEHRALILGGLWGIKKECLNISIKELYLHYNTTNETLNIIQHDQYFLKDIIYSLVYKNMIVYSFNEKMKMIENEIIKRIPFNVIDDNFCGLAITYDEDGNEIKEYKWDVKWNFPTISLIINITDDIDNFLESKLIKIFYSNFKEIQNQQYNYHIYLKNCKKNFEQIQDFLENKLINALIFNYDLFEINNNKYVYNKRMDFNDDFSHVINV